ncbi:arginine--tRNA ligase [Brochothrix campestris]|nr:arginine--tRNA ligase [Brochothrix campestris]
MRQGIADAVIAAGLTDSENMPSIVLETPKDKSHGDFSTNVAMQLTRIAKKAPRVIAETVIANLDTAALSIEKVEIAGPGFINFTLDNAYLTEVVSQVLTEKAAYGNSTFGKKERVLIEFVSANPTGDLHLGHGRGAAIGDSLANIMSKVGFDVSREYYINDAGNQINNLVLSAEARYHEVLNIDWEFPEDGYRGKDILTLGQQLADKYGDSLVGEAKTAERQATFRQEGLAYELAKLKTDLKDFRVNFDTWFSEQTLYDNNQVLPTLDVMKQSGRIFEEDGATWFRSTEFGDDKDRVLIKTDGSYTYLFPDIAYHKNKFDRGFDTLIDVWGADHHGYIARMNGAIQALGYNADQFEVQIIQLVRLMKGDEIVKMSKRTGKSVTMRDLVEMVGLDAARFYFAMRSSDTHLDFDLELATSQSSENPVFYVQYAHARICRMLASAVEKGIAGGYEGYDASLLTNESELAVLKMLGDYQSVLEEAAKKRAPQRITRYLHDLASTFHRFYNNSHVIDSADIAQSKARLALCDAVRITLNNALSLIGVSAPEKM